MKNGPFLTQLDLPGSPFTGFNMLGKSDVVITAYFLIRVFEELPNYTPLLSATLSRGRGGDQVGAKDFHWSKDVYAGRKWQFLLILSL